MLPRDVEEDVIGMEGAAEGMENPVGMGANSVSYHFFRYAPCCGKYGVISIVARGFL
ncbi:hypothetical protein D3C80_1982790 [compost metagenome]